MFYIRKYSNCWAIHNDDTGKSRPLGNEEVEAVKIEFPQLTDEKLKTIFTDTVTSIDANLSENNKIAKVNVLRW